jgi:AhpD family alkylhydroperoxidase
MKNPAMIIPGAMEALQNLAKASEQGGVPKKTLDLVHLRASQINGCSLCVDMGFRFKKADETIERLFAVAAWKDAPYFTDAERAALALTEAATRLSDRFDPVPDKIWSEAARHYDEGALASLVLWIAMTNVWNRLNVATKQVAGEWAKSAEAQKWNENSSALPEANGGRGRPRLPKVSSRGGRKPWDLVNARSQRPKSRAADS